MERKDVLMDAIKKMELLLLAWSKKITHNQDSPTLVAEAFFDEFGLDLFSSDMADFSKQVNSLIGMDQNNLLSIIALLQDMQGNSAYTCFALGQKTQVLKHILRERYKVFVF